MLAKAARALHEQSRDYVGSRQLSAKLQLHGFPVGRYRARTLIKCQRLTRRRRPHAHYRRATKPTVVAPNHLNRQFDPAQPNQRSTGDITQIRIGRRWWYVTVMMDLFPPDHRPGHRHDSRGVPGRGSPEAGRGAPPAQRRAVAPLRSRLPIQRAALRRLPGRARHPAEHELSRQPLGQRGGRALLPYAKGRMAAYQRLHLSGSGQQGLCSLPDVLRPATAALAAR